MKRLFLFAMVLCGTMTTTAQDKQLFDDNWQFTRNGKTTNVNLPHDWDIYEGPNSGKGATGTGGGWFEGGKGEYRKTFKTPNADITKLHFEGVYQKAEVFVNGQKAGQHGYGYTPFTIDVTRYLNKDKKQPNEVIVKVNNSEQPNCRWYSGSGIYRHVWLETMPALNASQADRQLDAIEVTFNEGSFKMAPQTSHILKQYFEHGYTMHKASSLTVDFHFTIANPHLWSPEDPHLYEAIVKLKSEDVSLASSV